MEKLIEGALAESLKKGRDRFNTKFAYARRLMPALEGDIFAEHLRLTLTPIAGAVNRSFPDKLDEVVDALYDLLLELTGKGFIGEQTRYPALLEGWRELLPSIPHLLAADAAMIAGSVSNAIYNLSSTAGARPHHWITEMIQIGRMCRDAAAFLEAGKVAAWRSGLAHYREGALTSCRNLAPDIARAALGILDINNAAPIETVLDHLASDPWLNPVSIPVSINESANRERRLRIVSMAGAFRGFGGFFPAPPRVAVSGGEFFVFDNETWWMLAADFFGSTLHRIGSKMPGLKNEPNSAFLINKNGKVAKGNHTAEFPALSNATSFASSGTTLAVTLPLSHSIYLIAMAEDSR